MTSQQRETWVPNVCGTQATERQGVRRQLAPVSLVLAACGLLAITAQAQTTRTWDGGGVGGADNSGNWSAALNWSSDNVPDTGTITGENADLPNVTSGTRTVTVDSPSTIYRLLMTQTTAGASNVLTLGQNLTLLGSATPVTTTTGGGAAAPIINVGGYLLTATNSVSGTAMAPTFGTLNIGNGGQLLMEQAQDVNWLTTITPTFGPVNLTGTAQIRLKGSQNNSTKTFNGPVNVSGSGAVIATSWKQWLGDAEYLYFNAPVTVAAGGSLSIQEPGVSLGFNGSSGQTGIVLGAGATLTVDKSGRQGVISVNGASLAADPATRLTLRNDQNFTFVSTNGALDIGSGAVAWIENTYYLGGGGGVSVTPYFGPINFGANAQLVLKMQDTTSPKTFNGPIAVTGTNALVSIQQTRWVGGATAVNAPITVTGSGSGLTWTDAGSASTFGAAGQTGITIAAGCSMVWSNRSSAQATINGLSLAADPATSLTLKAPDNVGIPAAPTTLDGPVSLGSGSTVMLDFGAAAGSAMLSVKNTATILQDGATVVWNWSASGNNGGSRNFVNAGNWVMQNGARIAYVSTTGRPTWALQDNANSGTMRIRSGSSVFSCVLANYGTLELSTNTWIGNNNVSANVIPDVISGQPIVMLRNASTSAVIEVTGDTVVGYTNYSGVYGFLLNGTTNIPGGQLKVGSAVASVVLRVRAYNDFFQNANANTTTVAAASTLSLVSDSSSDGHNFYGHASVLANAGSLSLGGKVQLRGNATAEVSINNGALLSYATNGNSTVLVGFTNANSGTFTVASDSATIELAAGGRSYQVSPVFRNAAGATLQGTGKLTYINNSGVTDYNSLPVQNSGLIAPTSGGRLTIQNVMINNAGTVDLNNAALILENGSLTNSSMVSIQNGLLEANTFVQPAGTMTNSGGIYQYSVTNPVVKPTVVGSILLTNGTISFRAVTNANVWANWAGGNQLTNITYQGVNAFRLDNATNSGTGQAYTFTDSAGPTNYASLELLNGSLYRGGNVSIGANGSLLVSNGVSTISGALTFAGSASLYIDISSTNGFGSLVALTNVNLNGCALHLNMGSSPVLDTPFTIISNASAGVTSGEFAAGYKSMMTINNTNYVVLINAAGGSGNDVVLTTRLQTLGSTLIIE